MQAKKVLRQQRGTKTVVGYFGMRTTMMKACPSGKLVVGEQVLGKVQRSAKTTTKAASRFLAGKVRKMQPQERTKEKGRRGIQRGLANRATVAALVVRAQLALPAPPVAVGAALGVALGVVVAAAAATRTKLRGTKSRISRSNHQGAKLMINRRRLRRSVK
jgi:hypothetical protein